MASEPDGFGTTPRVAVGALRGISVSPGVATVARGGTDAPGNLVVACAPCNRLKGDMHPTQFFARYPWAGVNFVRYARAVHRALKRGARRAVSLALAA